MHSYAQFVPLKKLLAQLRTGAVVVDLLPVPDAVLLARAAFRTWIRSDPQAGELVHLDISHLPDEEKAEAVISEALQQARGGWLLVTGDRSAWDKVWPAGLAKEAGVRLLRALPPPKTAPDGWHLLCDADQHYLPAVDPALASLRAQLSALCQRGESILLRGEAGSGRRSLAAWAADEVGQSELAIIGSGAPPGPTTGRWMMFAEVEHLSGPLHKQLQQHLFQRQRPPRRRRWPEPAPPPLSRRSALKAFDAFTAYSAAMRATCERLSLLARSASVIFLFGEVGVGKSMLAEAIRVASGKHRPLVPVELHGISEDLAKSRLFGHKRGSFTGAHRDKDGALREAHHGVLFIDELDKIGSALQPLLNRVLDDGTGGGTQRSFRPLGADRVDHVDVLIVAASNVHPDVLLGRGFAADLMSRLRPTAVEIPPLRERDGEILLLLEQLRAIKTHPDPVHAARHGDDPSSAQPIDAAVRAALEAYAWPSNVRELKALAEELKRSVGSRSIRLSDLPPHIATAGRPQPLLLSGGRALGEASGGWVLSPSIQPVLSTDADLHMPPLSARDSSLRRAALSLLQGRPIETAALNALVERARGKPLGWLRRAVPGLLGAGRVTLSAVQQALPLGAGDAGAFRVWWSPALSQGRAPQLVGMHRTFTLPRVLVGRAPYETDSVEEKLTAITQGAPLERLGTPGFSSISRAHFLVSRTPEALVIDNLGTIPPDVVWHGGRRAVRVQLNRRGRCLLDLWFTLGEDGEAVMRSALALQPASPGGPTEIDGAEEEAPPSPASPVRTPPAPSRAWALSLTERTLLHTLVSDAARSDVSFSSHIIRELAQVEGEPEWAWLRPYLLRHGRIVTQCVRLYQAVKNERMRRELKTRIGSDAALLPKQLQDLLPPQSPLVAVRSS
ncbi:MAG: transcriptional regulator with AAA-type ATPase domain [Myxococcota bacterium]|jgi:transcriptional regulator with AAA-type ATPase domain